MSGEQFLNTKEDVEWLFDTHLKHRLTSKYRSETKSFILFGNEDCPDKVIIFAAKNPLVTSTGMAIRLRDCKPYDVSSTSGHSTNPPLVGMKIVGSNMIQIVHGNNHVLYSYETPVAILSPSGLWVTDVHHSSTTDKHISKWFRSHGLDWKGAKRISQQHITVAAQQGTDPEVLENLQSLSKQMKKPRHRGHQPNPGKFGDEVESMLYGIDHDQTAGDVHENGHWYGLVSGLTLPEAKEYVASVAGDVDSEQFAIDAGDYDWPLNAIISEDSQGFISVETFKSNREAIAEWRRIESELGE